MVVVGQTDARHAAAAGKDSSSVFRSNPVLPSPERPLDQRDEKGGAQTLSLLYTAVAPESGDAQVWEFNIAETCVMTAGQNCCFRPLVDTL